MQCNQKLNSSLYLTQHHPDVPRDVNIHSLRLSLGLLHHVDPRSLLEILLEPDHVLVPPAPSHGHGGDPLDHLPLPFPRII